MPRALRFWPFLIPIAWAVAIFSFMRPDAIAARPEIPFALKWLIYDETDLTAFALRGGNAADGRQPGRTVEPIWRERIDSDNDSRPKSERFYFEYPLPSLLYFRLPYYFTGPPSLSSAVADGHQYPLGQHVPRDDGERAVFASLRTAVRFDVVAATIGLVVLMVVLGHGNGYRFVWLAALPGAVYFSLNRFDIFPALMTALAFACLARGKSKWTGAILGAGVLLKLYPLLFVLIIARYLGVRASRPFLVSFSSVAGIGFGLSWALTDWTSLFGPLRVQFGRELEDGWTLYGKVLPLWLGRIGWARLLILGLVTAACLVRKPFDLDGVLRRCGIVLVAFVVLAVFWSPQWLLWFLPLLIPLARSDRRIVWAAVAIDVVNYLSFPVLFWVWWNTWPESVTNPLERIFTLARGTIWLALGFLLVRPRTVKPTTLTPDSLSELARVVINVGNRSGLPRSLTWVFCEVTGDPIFYRDQCLIPLTVSFEPVPGSDMEDVPAARIPRPVTGVFRWVKGTWVLDRAPVFNLSPEQVRDRLT